MPDHDLLVIALPNGKTSTPAVTTASLSVLFVPRLREDGELRDYRDWRDWPDARGLFNFQVLVDGVVTPYTIVSPAPSSDAWRALFAGTTRVDGWLRIDRSGVKITSFDETKLTEDILDLYQRIFVSNPEFPPTNAAALADTSIADLMNGEEMAGAGTYLDPTGPEGSPRGPDLDFHQYLQLISAHPQLLRHLGVVVDVTLTLPPGPVTNVAVRTNWEAAFGSAGNVLREARLQTEVTTDFRAAPNPDPDHQEHDNGWLKTKGAYSLDTLNSLAAAQSLGSYWDRVNQEVQALPTGTTGALPALQERGVSMLRSGHKEVILNRWIRRNELEEDIDTNLQGGGPVITLYSEDVSPPAQRIDVKDVTNKGTASSPVAFLSLFHRQPIGEYEFPRDATVNIQGDPDEGWTTTVLATDQNEGYTLVGQEEKHKVPTAGRRILDHVFTWEGWSAAAPMPASIIAGTSAVTRPTNAPPATAAAQLTVNYEVVPGTLPRLRYGHTYIFRGRVTDLAGNSWPSTKTNPKDTNTEREIFGRLLPVSSPTALRRGARPKPGVGDMSDVLVVKSDYNIPDSRATTTERVIFPPKAGQHTVELHDLPEGGVDIDSYATLAARDPLSVVDQTIVDPGSGELVSGVLKGRRVTPGPTNPAAEYLNDPAATAAALHNLPQAPGTVLAPFKGKWPGELAAFLKVKGGEAAPTVRGGAKGSTVTAFVPKSAVIQVELSAAIKRSLIDHFKLWRGVGRATQNDLRSLVLNGRHWMISGRTTLTLIHAVRRPLRAPAIVTLTADRPYIGATDITLTGEMTGHEASTERINLEAVYADPVDLVTEPSPRVQLRTAPLGDVAISAPAGISNAIVDIDEFDVSLQPSLHDTKRHLLRVKAEAFSRFTRYFTEVKQRRLTDSFVLHGRGVIASSVQLSNPTGDETYTEGADFTVDGKTGRVTRVADGRIRSGAVVKALYIPLPVSRHSTEGPGKLFQVEVPNSLPPAALHVKDVVPAFAFTANDTANLLSRRRNGRVVRLYLERPWHSTGMGELAAVIVDTSPGAIPGSTQFGRDPVNAGPGPSAPALADFPRATETMAAVDATHDAAGHEVHYDAAKQCWYLEVEVSGGGAYRPFIRLALARFQPLSIAGAHIGPILTLDPIRLGVERLTRVEKKVGGVQVRYGGVEHAGIPDSTAGNALQFNRVSAQWQQVDATIADADLRWVNVGPPTLLTRVPLADVTAWGKNIPYPVAADPIRLVINEEEFQVRDDGTGTLVTAYVVVYTEVVEIPADWTP